MNDFLGMEKPNSLLCKQIYKIHVVKYTFMNLLLALNICFGPRTFFKLQKFVSYLKLWHKNDNLNIFQTKTNTLGPNQGGCVV